MIMKLICAVYVTRKISKLTNKTNALDTHGESPTVKQTARQILNCVLCNHYCICS